jgi:NADH:ubiquinone oxidoreductase subunit
MAESFSPLYQLAYLGTHLFTWLRGEKVGTDANGNNYYREKAKPPQGVREKRWVMYKGLPEASKVPPEWHGWLHYTNDEPLPEDSDLHQAWVKPHKQNLTFTDQAYRPPGHFLKGGKRAKATGDYEAWKPVD